METNAPGFNDAIVLPFTTTDTVMLVPLLTWSESGAFGPVGG